MNNRAVGICFCAMATVLFLSRYIIAMMYYGFKQGGQSRGEFDMMLSFVGVLPWVLAAFALAAGIYYLIRKDPEK